MKTPTLSIIIPTLNEEAYLGGLLEDISRQTLKPHDVIVVDCRSSDRTQHIARSHGVHLIIADKPVGNQRHVGAQKAQGDMLVFLDADTRMETTFLEKSLEEMHARSLTIACPIYTPIPGSPTIRMFFGFFNILFRCAQYRKPSGAGSCIFISKDLYTQSGGCNASLTYDDIALIRTAGNMGTFGMLHTAIQVSDRRIRRDGLLKTVWTYMRLSALFARGSFTEANKVPYQFGHYSQK